MNQLSLLVPGLLGPLPELKDAHVELNECSILNRWLACAESSETGANGYQQQIADLFSENSSVSVSLLSSRVDGIDISEGYWLRADPVYFKADIDHALLIGADRLEIMMDEAQSMIESFNQHFSEDGLQLFFSHSQRWYLKSEQPFRLQTVATHDAIGRNVQNFLPKGEDEVRWRKILNETQMLFFSHPVNAQRESRGQMTINSVWLWGEGNQPEYRPSSNIDWVVADEVLAKGLASINNADCFQNNLLSIPERTGHGLCVIDDLMVPVSYGDVDAWHEGVNRICHDWLQPINELLKRKYFQQINLYTGEGRCFQITRASLLKFWRKRSPIIKYMNLDA